MQKTFYNTNLHSLRAFDTNLFVYSVYESIVLDRISVNGITSFGLELKNNSVTGNITEVSVYGSPNGIDYFLQESSVFSGVIEPGSIQHTEFSIITGFLRISVKTDMDINIDVYLHGNIV
jgi:hypothetical protein